MRLAYLPYKLQFKEPAGTSRGVMREKVTCLLKLWDEADPSRYGLGEAAVFEGLSKEATPAYEYKVVELLANIALGRGTDLTDFPSLQFGLEQAIADFTHGCRGLYFPSKFTEGKGAITINGLVWMGDIDKMLERLEKKIAEGFRCIKLKIGAIDFRQEMRMLSAIRGRFSPEQLEVRVDANGGFSMDQVMPALAHLAEMGVHSIEQPIPAGHWDLMQFLCQVSPVKIALDEELIGLNRPEQKARMLDEVRPAYIVLKPALCGGFSGAQEWIDLATERGIGWWVTSALESNIGLNALAQWVATLDIPEEKMPGGTTRPMPQGLGTGALYTNNFTCPLTLTGELLEFNPKALPVSRAQFNDLPWRE